MGFGLVQNNNYIHRGFRNNDNLQEDAKGALRGRRCGECFGTTMMTIATATTGGATKHHQLSRKIPISILMCRITGHARGNSDPKREVFCGEDMGWHCPKIRFLNTPILLKRKSTRHVRRCFEDGGWGHLLLHCLANISWDISCSEGGSLY